MSTLGLDDYDYRGLLFYTSYTDAKVVGFQICQKIETIIILTYYDVIIRYKIERIITAEGFLIEAIFIFKQFILPQN